MSADYKPISVNDIWQTYSQTQTQTMSFSTDLVYGTLSTDVSISSLVKRREQTWILEENHRQELIDPVEERDKPAAQAQKAVFTLELKRLSWATAFLITILSETKDSISHLQYSSVGKVKEKKIL